MSRTVGIRYAEAVKFGVGREKTEQLLQRLQRLGVREEDLLEKFVRAQGPGGQKVNKTSSAVYLKHLPSGIEVKAQAARSQSMNRFFARRLLADKLEAKIEGRRSAEQQRIAKIRRQKRKRSKRAKAKMLDDKRKRSDTKNRRKRPVED